MTTETWLILFNLTMCAASGLAVHLYHTAKARREFDNFWFTYEFGLTPNPKTGETK